MNEGRINEMNYNRFSKKGSVCSAMIATDTVMFLEAVFFGADNAEEGLKSGEVAFGGLKKPRLRIYDPNNPRHSIVCRNVLTYPQLENNVIFMNIYDYSYFKSLGFEAGDEVYITEE